MLFLNDFKIMTSHFLRKSYLASSPVYVLSQIPKLSEDLKVLAAPATEIRTVKLPEKFSRNLLLNVDQIEYVREAEIVVCDGLLLANNYDKFPNLKWAHCTWAGVEPVIAAIPGTPSFVLTRHGGEAFSSIMAEYVVCQILNSERNMKELWKSQDANTWARMDRFETFRTLDELSVGILGVGSMATGIARFLKSRGTSIMGFAKHSRQFLKECSPFDSVKTDLEGFLPCCDYLVNTLPSTVETRGLLDGTVLQCCSKKPIFINVGRGNVISEDDLILALKNGWLSGAVLDVFKEEPLPPNSLLWNMPQVTITPHIAAVSKPKHIAEEFFNNLRRYVNGEEMLYVVNWTSGY